VIAINVICEHCAAADKRCEHCDGRGYQRRQIDTRERHAGLAVDVQERIISLYVRGASLREVARQVFVDHSTVAKVLHDYAIPTRPRGGSRPATSTEQMLEVGELYASGMSTIEIAQTLDVAATTVRRRLRHLGGHRRTRSEALTLAYQRGRRA
jgi:DNA-binding NarL/FixJ family response regulator